MQQPILVTPGDASRTTTWLNPLDVPQKVDVHMDGRLMRYVIPSKAKVEIPVGYDSAIHIVHGCNDEGCRQRGGPCRKPGQHGGVVSGGLAPQLVNMTAAEAMSVAKALDTETQKREDKEAEMRLAAQAVAGAEKALMTAAHRLAEEKAEAKPSDAKPAAAAQTKK